MTISPLTAAFAAISASYAGIDMTMFGPNRPKDEIRPRESSSPKLPRILTNKEKRQRDRNMKKGFKR